MGKGNVLVVGNAGVGKSTLINAVLGDDYAVASYGTKGTTSEVHVYEKDSSPFNLVDTVGFEPNFIKENIAINGIKKWSIANAKDGNEDNDINAIWFCVDGMAAKLFSRTLKNLVKATSVWKTVPVIVVVTKSFSEPDQKKNIEMVREAAKNDKHLSEYMREIIPVVAQTLAINDTTYVPVAGVTELIDATELVLPEGRRAAKSDVFNFKCKRKKALSQGVVGGATAAAAVVGAIPIPLADALILGPIEITMTGALAKLYDIGDDENSKKLLEIIVETGTVSIAAKAAIDALKVIPGVNIATAPLNAVIAGGIVAAIGESSVYAFEKIYRGEKSVADTAWVQALVEKALSEQFVSKVANVIKEFAKDQNSANMAKQIASLLMNVFGGTAKKAQ